MANVPKTGNGNNGHLPIEDRVGRLEIALERVITQLDGSIDHITNTLDQLGKRVDGGKPNWVGIIAICLAFAGLIGTLFTVSTDGKIAPVKGDIAHIAEIISIQIATRNRELELRQAQMGNETKLRDEINALMHGQFDRRVTSIEERLRTRMSDADDRQDAQTTALQKEIDMIRGKIP